MSENDVDGALRDVGATDELCSASLQRGLIAGAATLGLARSGRIDPELDRRRAEAEVRQTEAYIREQETRLAREQADREIGIRSGAIHAALQLETARKNADTLVAEAAKIEAFLIGPNKPL